MATSKYPTISISYMHSFTFSYFITNLKNIFEAGSLNVVLRVQHAWNCLPQWHNARDKRETYSLYQLHTSCFHAHVPVTCIRQTLNFSSLFFMAFKDKYAFISLLKTMSEIAYCGFQATFLRLHVNVSGWEDSFMIRRWLPMKSASFHDYVQS